MRLEVTGSNPASKTNRRSKSPGLSADKAHQTLCRDICPEVGPRARANFKAPGRGVTAGDTSIFKNMLTSDHTVAFRVGRYGLGGKLRVAQGATGPQYRRRLPPPLAWQTAASQWARVADLKFNFKLPLPLPVRWTPSEDRSSS